MGKSIAINAGSSTLKFKLYEMPSEKVITSGAIDRIGIGDSDVTIKYGDGEKFSETMNIQNHEEAIQLLLDKLLSLNIINDYNEITGVGHRVVAGGEYFTDSVVIDDEVLAKIEDLVEFAPLHQPANIMGIKAFKKILPDVISVAVFDTSFHTTLPETNYMYSLPYEYYEKHKARKYGAHGTSYRYVSARAAAMLDKPIEDLKMIIMHLGAGASLDAIKGGKSFDTSMGFTPVTGITMATRSGDVDPSVLQYIMQKEDISDFDDVIDILNHKSGLLGISGVSSDMRDIEKKAGEGDHRSQLAHDIFINRVVRYVGSYIAEMGGVDAIVFTAGIGENDKGIRAELAEKLACFGVKIDDAKNDIRGEERDLSSDDATVKTLLIPTDEEVMIVRDIERLRK